MTLPPLMPRGIQKGISHGGDAGAATIPPDLANCLAEYAERILEMANA